MKAIVCSAPGGPQVMELREIERPVCPPDGVVARVEAVGVNFIDTYERDGTYTVDFPFTPGKEGAGVIVEAGPDAAWAAVGDRVAWTFTPRSYAEYVVLRASDCFTVPVGVEAPTAAAAMLQGLTAHYLARSTYALDEDDVALIHAGAGGVGLLLTQFAKLAGATVITTVSSEAKAALSRAAGADVVIRYDEFDDLTAQLPAAVREATGGRGVDVVYDGVGKTTFDASLASLDVRGTMVLFGGASGQVPAFDLQRLNKGGSLSITRPSLGHYMLTQEERSWRVGELFEAIASGDLDVRIGATYPLADAASAHEALQGRGTTGKVLLLP